MEAQRGMPAVEPAPEDSAFFEAGREGRLLLRHCTDCDQLHWYPRAVCPHCFGEKLRWRPASGQGSVYTFSPMRRIDPPYTIAYVRLDEGPMLLTNLVRGALDDWHVGQRVQVVFQPNEAGDPMPCFEPVGPTP